MATGELACTYASLILHENGIPITSEKISNLVTAANVKVESSWASLFAKLLEKKNIDDLITKVGSGGGAAAVAAPPAAASAAAPAFEEKKAREDPEEESDDELDNLFGEGGGLFGHY